MKNNYKWIIKISIIALLLSMIFTFLSDTIISNVSIVIGLIITIAIIFIGIIFDMIGVSIASVDEAPFHAMASKKKKATKTALKLIKNKDKVSSFCCDVIGDICGIISGSTGAVIIVSLTKLTNGNNLFISLIVMGIISSLTIAGKAAEKRMAMNNSTKIIYTFAKILSIFEK